MKQLPLSRGLFALVDDEDFERLALFRWWAMHSADGKRTYAYRQVNRRNVYMHRAILNPAPGMVCDHINHNGLDNRRENLRAVTRRQNQENLRNQSRHGVGIQYRADCPGRPWRATVETWSKHEGRRSWGKSFATKDEAVAYRASEVS